MTTAYPLHWPMGFPRTKAPQPSRFKTSLPGALGNVEDELRRFASDTGRKIENYTISSNFTLTDRNPKDGGVAVYLRWDGIDVCFPCDQYRKIEENVQAVAKVVEAHRAILRHGGLNIVRAAFRGFAALPPPKGPDGQLEAPWWQVMGFEQEPRDMALVDARYRELVKQHHPDRGGDPAAFNRITDAIRQARVWLGE